MKIKHNKGISIGEVLVVLAVLIAIVAVVLPQFGQIRNQQVLRSGVVDITSAIDKARSKTLSSLNSSSYGVHFQSDRIVIFTGTTYSAVASDNEVINIVTPANISNVTLGGVSSTSGDMYFNRLNGEPNVNGTITLSSNSADIIITISATGITSFN